MVRVLPSSGLSLVDYLGGGYRGIREPVRIATVLLKF
jgi:hypothetical protein